MWVLARNLGEILREFGEILGKYRILDDSSLGSKGLKPILHYALVLRFGKVCEQEREKNATGSCFYPKYAVI